MVKQTPAHSESEFYTWDAKNVGNLSLYFDDDYKINFGTDYSFNLGWMLERKTLSTKDQSFQVNGTEATYKQDNDLVEEKAGNFGFEKNVRRTLFKI